MRKRITFVWDVDSIDKFSLKIRIDSRFNIPNPMGDFLSLCALDTVQQGDTRPITGSITNRVNFVQIAIGNHAQNHGIFWIDVAAESTTEK